MIDVLFFIGVGALVEESQTVVAMDDVILCLWFYILVLLSLL